MQIHASSENGVNSSVAAAVEGSASASQLFEARVLRSFEELEGIRDFWTQHQIHPNCDFDFYSHIVKTRPSIQRPHVVVLYRDHQPVAALVGRLENGTVDLRVGYKKVLGLRSRTLTFLHGGLIGDASAENCAEMARSVIRSLDDAEAEVAYFNHLRTGGPLFSEILKLDCSPRRRRVAARSNHRGMTLFKTGQEFLSSLSSRERNNQKRRLKRLNEEFSGQVRISCYRQRADLETMVQDINRIARGTYQRSLGVGFEDNADNRQQLEIALTRGWMRAYVLYLADRPSAFWMGNVFSNIFYSGFTGYDPALSKYAPGMFLLLKALEQLCEENSDGGIRTADFGLGDAEWKHVVGDLKWEEAPIYLFSQTSRGRLLNLTFNTSKVLDAIGKKALGRLQLVGRVKRAWRNRLTKQDPSRKTPAR